MSKKDKDSIATEKEENKWREKCADITKKMVEFKFESEVDIIEAIVKKFTEKELIICAHQYLTINAQQIIAKKQSEIDEKNRRVDNAYL